MAARKHVLGLHTKDERKHAYSLARNAYQFGISEKASPHDAYYALGYVDAITDLVRAEVPDDEELLGLLDDMQTALLDKSAIPSG